MSAIDHLDLVVTSREQSLDFYRGLLEPLGYVRTSVIEGERGERVVYLGRVGEGGDLVAEVRRLTARLERLERERG